MSSGYLEMNEGSPITLTNQTHGGGTYATASGVANEGEVPLVVRVTSPSLELPAGMVKWSHLEVIIEKGADAGFAASQSFKAYVTWDVLGQDIAAGPTQTEITMVGGATDQVMASATLDISPSRPPDGEKSKAYVWFATNGFHTSSINTDGKRPIVKRCRLYWYSLGKG